jgi:16S rRNA (guanine527-N7)-methyltransferase
VKPLNVLVELCIPFLKIGGFFLAMKGPSINEEIEAALKGIEVLGGRIIERFDYVLPSEAGERCILIIEKVKETPPSYPRKPGIPEKRPL